MSSGSPSGVDPGHTVPVVDRDSDNPTPTYARSETPPLPPTSSLLPVPLARFPQTPKKSTTAVSQNSTPLVLRTSGMFESAHTREMVYPLIRFDLEHYSKPVTVDQWVSCILNVPPEKITEWSKHLGFTELLDKPTMDNLKDYCYASLEPHRYTPWSAIVNKIVSLAPSLIKGLPLYPLTLRFARNDLTIVRSKIEEAKRKPDVVVIDKSFCPNNLRGKSNDSETPGIGWKEIVACVEFKKYENNKISDPVLQTTYQELKTALEDGPGGLEKFISKKSSSDPSREVSPSSDSATTPQVTSAVSRKRKAVEDLASESVPPKVSKTNSQVTASSMIGMRRSDTEQLASYALELLSLTSGTRMHCLQIYVDGDRMKLWYYDAGGVVHSEWMYWIHEFPKFAAIIVAFVQLDLGGWGIGNIPNLTPPLNAPSSTNPLPTSLSGYTLMMTRQTPGGGQEKVKVTLQKEVFTQYSLVGRRTIVYDITTEPQISTRPLVVKISMQTTARTPEHIFVKDAAEKGVRHLPEVHMWSDKDSNSEPEWRLSQGVWGKLFPGKEDKEYDDRFQRFIVFTKYRPIEGIISPGNMHNLLMQLIDCIHELRYKAYILHRDISLGNLMYEELSDGSIKLILNDFDLAVKVDKDGLPTGTNSSKHRTGTLPFMAHQLLNPNTATRVTHYVRHDFESVFLVALWLIINFSLHTKPTTEDEVEAQKAARETLKRWACGPLQQIYSDKKLMFTTRDSIASLDDKFTMGHFKNWVTRFRRVFIKAYRVLDDAKEESASDSDLEGPREIADMETLDGLISRDRIQTVLRRWEKKNAGAIKGFVPS